MPSIAYPDRARARDRRAHRGRRRGRRPVEGRPAGRGRLVRRELRALRPVPPRRHDQLRATARSRGSPTTAATPITWSSRPAPWRRSRTTCPPRRPRRCSAPASRRSTRCARAARGLVTSSPSSGSGVSAISACSSRAAWASRPWPSLAGPTRRRWRAGRAPLHRLHHERVAAALQDLGGASTILATVDGARCDERRGRRPAAAGADGRRRSVGRAHADPAVRDHPREHRRGRSRVGHVEGLRGHAALQRPDRRPR